MALTIWIAIGVMLLLLHLILIILDIAYEPSKVIKKKGRVWCKDCEHFRNDSSSCLNCRSPERTEYNEHPFTYKTVSINSDGKCPYYEKKKETNNGGIEINN